MPKQQSVPRYQIHETSDQLQITVLPLKNWLAIMLYACTAVLFSALTVYFIMYLVYSVYLLAVKQSSLDWFLFVAAIISLPVYVYATLTSFKYVFWKLTGQETIIVTPNSIHVERKVFRFRRLPPCLLEDIYDLQPAPRGGIEFTNHGWKSTRIGAELSLEDSRQVLDKIYARYPQYEQKKKADVLDSLQAKTRIA